MGELIPSLQHSSSLLGSLRPIGQRDLRQLRPLKPWSSLDFGHFWRVMWERRAAKRTMR